MLKVRTAEKAEFDVIMGIYRIAQDFMISTGNPNQWRRTNPTSEQIKEDIENSSYVSYECRNNLLIPLKRL